ncbi:MAG: 8-oxo-dGTP diphosphatase MutT [Tatlockia sp.]|nr:8-oxo-dGTP diphosphatase MutT [Tatlockia sp.]
MKVAVAVIFDEQQRVLITKRPANAAHGGLWEFPGGKLEEGEPGSAALIREIKEEVGVDVLEYSFLGSVVHDYESKIVELLVYSVEKFKGKACCRESQSDLRWVNLNELALFNFPEANEQIIQLIKELA